jgi:serine/arginine repetitive matrix protein 1
MNVVPCPLLQVDLKKVNLDVIRPWIVKKVTELLDFEDEVIIEYTMGLLEDPNHTVGTFAYHKAY